VFRSFPFPEALRISGSRRLILEAGLPLLAAWVDKLADDATVEGSHVGRASAAERLEATRTNRVTIRTLYEHPAFNIAPTLRRSVENYNTRTVPRLARRAASLSSLHAAGQAQHIGGYNRATPLLLLFLSSHGREARRHPYPVWRRVLRNRSASNHVDELGARAREARRSVGPDAVIDVLRASVGWSDSRACRPFRAKPTYGSSRGLDSPRYIYAAIRLIYSHGRKRGNAPNSIRGHRLVRRMSRDQCHRRDIAC